MICTENMRNKVKFKAKDKHCNARLDDLLIIHYQKIQMLKKACPYDYMQSGIPP